MARKRPPSIDFYYEDFYSGTMGMHPLAVGMYIRSICFQLAHDSIPSNPRKLCQILGVTEAELTEHWGEVKEKLTLLDDGSYVNERAQVEMEKKLALSATRTECGKLGGRPRNQKVNQKVNQTTNQNESKTKAIGKKEVGSRKREKENGKHGSRKGKMATQYTPEFEEFWLAVAKRKQTKKPDAMAAWLKAVDLVADDKGMSEDDAKTYLLSRMHEYTKSQIGQTKFARGPEPWLNQQAWNEPNEAWVHEDNSQGTLFNQQQTRYEDPEGTYRG